MRHQRRNYALNASRLHSQRCHCNSGTCRINSSYQRVAACPHRYNPLQYTSHSRNVVHLVRQAPSTHHATLKSICRGTEIHIIITSHIIIIITSDSTGMRTWRFRHSERHNCQLPFTAYLTQYAIHSMFRRRTMTSTNIPHSRKTFSCIYVCTCTTAQSIQARAESIQLSRQCNIHMEKLALASSRSQSESPFSPFSGPESPFSPFSGPESPFSPFSGSQILPIS